VAGKIQGRIGATGDETAFPAQNRAVLKDVKGMVAHSF